MHISYHVFSGVLMCARVHRLHCRVLQRFVGDVWPLLDVERSKLASSRAAGAIQSLQLVCAVVDAESVGGVVTVAQSCPLRLNSHPGPLLFCAPLTFASQPHTQPEELEDGVDWVRR